VVKEYWAIVEISARQPSGQVDPGKVADEAALIPGSASTWEDWLTPAGPDGKVRAVPPNSPNSRQARTVVIRRESPRLPANLAWLQMWPATGRTHQLRAQAAIRGIPILGDSIYGSVGEFPTGIALHARGLKIRHPADQSELNLLTPPPESWPEFGVS